VSNKLNLNEDQKYKNSEDKKTINSTIKTKPSANSGKDDLDKNNANNGTTINMSTIDSGLIQFTRIRRGESSTPTKAQIKKYKVPKTDVLIDDDYLEIFVELPGATKTDIQLNISDEVIKLNCSNKDIAYYTEINLPGKIVPQSVIASFNDSKLRIKAEKEQGNTIWSGIQNYEKVKMDLVETKEKLVRVQEKLHSIQLDYQNLLVKNKKELETKIDIFRISVIEKLLRNIDNFELALKSSEKSNDKANKANDQIVIGLRMILNELNNLILEEGVEEIFTKGMLLDPNKHDVVDCTETTEYPVNTIIEEYQKGYSYKNRIIRPSKVRVAISPKDTKLDRKLDTKHVKKKDTK
jgi:molecular chaperone GrpE